MIDDRFRPFFARAAAPAVRVLVKLGVSPIHVTLSGFVLAVLAAFCVGFGLSIPGLVLWLVSRMADGLDGLLARATNRTSALGGYLDITLDMAAYSVMILGFAAAHSGEGLVWSAILVGYVLCITTTLALSAALEGLDRVHAGDRSYRFTPGLAEAGETSLSYALFVLFPQWIGPLAWIWCAATWLTGVQRTVLAVRLLRP